MAALKLRHQIADLEAYLGVRLFEGLARDLKLTAEGSALFAGLGQCRSLTSRH